MIINVKSFSDRDVQAAIDSACHGDTIIIPKPVSSKDIDIILSEDKKEVQR